jgi:hypothetical protein
VREFKPQPKPVKKEKLVTNSAIRARSKKRATQERIYAKQRIEFLKDNPYCVGRFEGCTNIATCIQHSEGRIGALLTDVRTFRASCYSCNLKAETNPAEALKMGFSKKRLHG